MEALNNVGEVKDVEPEAVLLGSTAEEERGREQALDEIAGISQKVSRRHSRSSFLKVPLAVIIVTLLAFIAYHMTALILKDRRALDHPWAGLAGLLSVGKGGVDGPKGKQADLPELSGETPVKDQLQKLEDRQQPGAPAPRYSSSGSASRASTGSTGEKYHSDGEHQERPEEGAPAGRDSLPPEGSAEESLAEPAQPSLTSVSSEEASPKPEGIEDEQAAGSFVVEAPVRTSSEESGREFGDGDFSDAQAGEDDSPERQERSARFDKERLKGSGSESSLGEEEEVFGSQGEDDGYLASDEGSVGDEDSSMDTDELGDALKADSDSDSDIEPIPPEAVEKEWSRGLGVRELISRFDEVREMVQLEAERLEGKLQWIGHVPYGENDWSEDDVFED